MGFCTNCGAEVKEGSKFCESCGALQEQNQNEKQKKTKVKEKKDSKQGFNPEFYLWFGLMFLYLVPTLIESLLMLKTKVALSSTTVLAIELLGILLAYGLFSKYLSLKTSDRSSNHVKTTAVGILIMYAFYIGSLRLTELISDLAMAYFYDIYFVYFIAYFVVVVIALLGISKQLFMTLQLINGSPRKSLFKYPKLFWKTIIFLGFGIFILPDFITIIFSGVLIDLPLSFISTLTPMVILVALQGYILISVVESMLKNLEMNQQPVVKTKPDFMKWIALVVVLGLFGLDMFSTIMYSTADAIEASIQDDMNQGAFYMAAGDIEMAMYMYDSAYSKSKAWISFLRDTPEAINDLRTLYNNHPDDDEIKYLLAMKTYNIYDLETVIFESEDTSRWYHALLAAYNNQENNEEHPQPLSEKQEVIRKEILNACIAGQTLINSGITLKDIEGKEDDIIKRIEPYLGFIEAYDAYKIVNQISLNGGMSVQIIDQLLTYAETHPDNLLGQYLAFQGGRQFLFDGAYHYERTAQAAIRFRDLYVSQLKKDKDTQTIAVDMEIADALMGLHDYQNAALYLEEAHALGAKGDTMLLAAYCYEALENYEKSLEMAETAITENPSNQTALNIAMISALKIGEITKSLEYASDLLDLLPTLEGEDYLLTDADLYIFVQYLTVWDQTQWTPQMKYKVYPNLDEEQFGILENNALLNHYVQALYYTFSDKKYDEAWIHAEALLSEMEKSAQVQYLAGTIQFNKREFEEAVKYYQASLALDDTAPTLWFALANAYDALGKYKLAYNCTLEVNGRLQYSNHAVDIYGVQYHNNVLMNRLASKLQEEVN
ncbi:MAG: zinc-ribbon domain-containing protein [Clostridia bacterium]|nr:zinc-ribbon domain-containing protein [Clostridia bacterium]